MKSQSNLQKVEESGDIKLLYFKLYFNALVIKQYGIGIEMDTQINGTAQSPEIKPCIYGQLIYNKAAITYNGISTVNSLSGAGKNGRPHAKG